VFAPEAQTDPTKPQELAPPEEAPPQPSPVDELRQTLESFVSGGEVDADKARHAMRVIGALLMNEGFFDDARLRRVLELLATKAR
jgi:hypothetical protein